MKNILKKNNDVLIFAKSNLMKNNVFCKVMLLWDQLCYCFCNIEPNEKQWFLQGNAVVGSITSLLLQQQT